MYEIKASDRHICDELLREKARMNRVHKNIFVSAYILLILSGTVYGLYILRNMY